MLEKMTWEERMPGEIETIDGQEFRIQRLMGQGGMAKVYEAIDPNGKKVALKIYFAASARQWQLIKHAHETRRKYPEIPRQLLIHPIFSGLSGKAVCDLVEGDTAKEQAKNLLNVTNAIRSARDLVLKTVPTLDLLAQKGLVHRDIKGSNLQLVPDADHATLLDIDLLTEIDHPLNHDGGIWGSKLYLSPEQCTNHAGNKTDMFGLAATVTFDYMEEEIGHIVDIGESGMSPDQLMYQRVNSTSTANPDTQNRLLDLDRYPEEVRDEAYGLLMFIIAALQPGPKDRPANSTVVKQLLVCGRNATMFAGPAVLPN